MALNTHLSDRALREHLRRFPIGELIEARGVAAGTAGRVYHLSTTRGRYILRIVENRSESDARFEEALLNHLAAEGLMVPRMVVAGKAGCVVPISAKEQLSVFQYLPGREIGVFEVRRGHARQVGEFIASMHLAGRGLGRRRRNRFDPRAVSRLLTRCRECGGRPDIVRDIDTLLGEVDRHEWPRSLPRGVVHGNLLIDNVRFSSGDLSGAIDFETACTAPFVYDLGIAVSDWGFSHDELVADLVRSMVEGYDGIRPLKLVEREALYDMSRFAMVRYGASRIYDFEIRRRVGARRLYKDYRHFTARLASLRNLGPDTFLRLAFP